MIFRLSQKLAARIKISASLAQLSPHENPFADWSAHQFAAGRTQYLIFCNTRSLYCTLLPAKGVTSDKTFVTRTLESLGHFMAYDGLEHLHRQCVLPVSGQASFAKPVSRSLISSMNDLIVHARLWLVEESLSPHDAAFKLNDIPFSSLDYRNPREVFTGMPSLD